jgi:hypothetical protein
VELTEIYDSAVGFVALAALLGIVLLFPLYISQRRDVQRLRAWRERVPGYAGENLAESESALDRAEGELKELLGEAAPATREEEEAAPADATPTEPATAAYRVTHERPALERITMERAALVAHPRWRRFVSRVTTAPVLITIGVVALVVGAGAIFLSEELLKGGDEAGRPHPGAVVRSDVTVAVLNGTSIGGLAGLVGSDVEASGYELGATTNTTPGVVKSFVMYADHQKPAAQKVAKDIGVKKVQPLDRESRRLAEGADVVVVVGEDRANA